MKNNAIDLEGFWTLVKRLNEDAKRCFTALEATPESNEDEKSFWRRMYARSVFALIEAATYRMTYHAYAASGRPGVSFSAEELTRLETAYDFDRDREPVTSFGKTQTLDNIQFAFDAFARVHDCAYVLPIHDTEWVLINEIARIRETLQFCRDPDEIEVSGENIEVLLYGLQWFIERMVDLLESCCDSMSEGATAGELEDTEIIM